MSSFWDRPGSHNQYFVAVIASLGGLCLGSSMGWSAPAENYIESEKGHGFTVDWDSFAWISSLLSLGCCLIALPIVPVASYFGSKLTLLLMVPPYIAGWAMLIFAPNKFIIMLARFFQGLCVGSYVVLVPIYCIEIAQPEAKRAVRVFFVFLNALGTLYAFIAGAINSYMTLNYACAILPIIYFLMLIWLPESPVHYLKKNKPEKALRSLKCLRGRYVNQIPELLQIQESIDKNKENNPGIWGTLKMKSTRRALVRCIGLTFFQNCCGGPAILTYATAVLKEGQAILPFNPEYSTVILGITFVVAVFVALLLSQWLERRSMMMFSVWLLIIVDVMLAVFFHLRNRKDVADSFKWLPMTCLSCYTACYGLGLATLPYSLIIDLFPEHFCNIGIGICFCVRGLFIFISVQTFPRTLYAWDMDKFFWLLAGLSVLSILFLYLFIPETKGKTIAEIQKM